MKDHSDHYLFGKTEQRLRRVHPNQILIMQQQLEMKLKDPQLVVRTNHQWLSVYLGDKLLYKYSDSEKQKEPGLLQTAIHLPENYQKQKLRIITKTPYEYYTGIPARVFIGEAAEVNRFFVLQSLPQVLLTIFCFGLIISTLLFLFFKPKKNKKDYASSLLLTGFIFLIGLQSLVLNVPASTLFEPKSLSVIYNLTTILIPICLTNYYLLRTKKYRHFYLYGTGSQILLLSLGLLSMAVGYLSLAAAVQIFSGFHVFMTLFTAAIALAEAADQNRFYTICSPGIIMAAFIHCFFYIQLFTGATNLTTDWTLILFSGLMLLICGYQFEEDSRLIRQTRIAQQEQLQQTIISRERQKNLVTTFRLLAEKEMDWKKTEPFFAHLFQQIQAYYQKEFRKQGKFFVLNHAVETEIEVFDEENLCLVIQLFEKFLNDPSFGIVDISIQQDQNQLVIESSTNAFTHHFLDDAIEATAPVDSHPELEQAVKQSNGNWHWQTKEKQQYFKITLEI